MDIRAFSKALHETLGESGSEAVLDAINFYLMKAEDKDYGAPCEDKFVLLSILYDNYEYMNLFRDSFNALLNFNITFGGEKNEN